MLDKFNQTIFYFFLFFLPWQTILILRELTIANEKFQYGTIGIYFFEIILFIWILLNLSILKSCHNKKILYSVLVFIIYILLSIFWSPDKLISLYFLIPLLLGGLSFLILQKKMLSFKKFTFVFVFSIFLQGILGVYQFLNQIIYSNKWLGISEHLAWQGGSSVIETSAGRFLRAYGGMPHPNILGGFLAIAILLGVGAYLKATEKEKYWKYFLLICIVLNFFSLLVTFSRSALFSLFLGLFLFLVYYLYNKRLHLIKNLLFIISIFFLISALFFSLFSELLINRLDVTSRLEKKSINERLLFIKEAQEIITQKPILGTGVGNYTPFLLKNNHTPKEVWQFQPVHNIYLLIFAELGIIGFSLFLFIIIFIICDFLESFTKENTNRVIFSIVTISLLFLSLFDHWLWTTHSGVIAFWLILSFSREKYINPT
ncbi:MAG: O-antigen ligase family protein [Candidatus Moraniibacteriota bacterium]